MEMQFRHLERAIESQPMPPEFQDTKAWVYCNDCNAKSSVKYHWLGLKCGVCDSYNTAQMQMIRGPNRGSIPDEPPAESPPSPHRPHLRGRGPEISTQPQRTTNSAPPSAGWPNAYDPLRRTAHSQEPQAMRRIPLSPTSMTTSDGREPMHADSEEEYSDVDFWGLGVPDSRAGGTFLQDEVMMSDSEDEDDSQDDSEDGDISDEGDDGEDEDEDQMEIFGHR
ncbi:MAG: hypothetical protein Q9181_000310 [Wetmoreana brouardii]